MPGYAAEELDIYGADVETIMEQTKSEINVILTP